MSEQPTDPLIGRTLDGRYRVDHRIGRGGMGTVYRGRHLLMDQKVALKVLRPDRATDQATARRFLREARSTFRLDQTNCVRVTDFGVTDDGLMYLVMEYLDGRTLADELAIDGPLSPPRVAHVARQVCDALGCAHRLGFVHRDLKPDNVMLLRRGPDPDFAKVLDFGLAKIFDRSGGAFTTAFSVSPLTQQGTVFGTPEYMSPEQATGQELDPRTDLYSLGVLMYEMLTGVLPFQAATFMAILTQHVQREPEPPARRRPDLGIPEALDTVVMHCLAKKPAERPVDARTLSARLSELTRALSDHTARVPGRVAASETVDLGTSEVSALPAGAATRDPPVSPATAPTGPLSGAHTPTAPVAGPGRRRVARTAAAVFGGLALVATSLALLRSVDTGNAAANATSSDAGRPGAVTVPTPAADASVASTDAAPPDAASTDASTSTAPGDVEARRAPTASARTRAIRSHLRAARAARAAGNTLKQLAEADAALRLAPDHAGAAFLLGDALVDSGDVTNGCRYLRRARTIPQARTRFRDAACEDAGGD